MYTIESSRKAKQGAAALEKALAKAGLTLGRGKALDAVSRMAGFADWNAYAHSFSVQAIDAQLTDLEQSHVADAGSPDYGPESVILVHTGFTLRAPAFPEDVSYVRIVDPLGRETAYWTSDEWAESAEDVMGAVLGALCRGQPAPDVEVPRRSRDSSAAKSQDVPEGDENPGREDREPSASTRLGQLESRVAELEDALQRVLEGHEGDLYSDAREVTDRVRWLARLRQWGQRIVVGAPAPDGPPSPPAQD